MPGHNTTSKTAQQLAPRSGSSLVWLDCTSMITPSTAIARFGRYHVVCATRHPLGPDLRLSKWQTIMQNRFLKVSSTTFGEEQSTSSLYTAMVTNSRAPAELHLKWMQWIWLTWLPLSPLAWSRLEGELKETSWSTRQTELEALKAHICTRRWRWTSFGRFNEIVNKFCEMKSRSIQSWRSEQWRSILQSQAQSDRTYVYGNVINL